MFRISLELILISLLAFLHTELYPAIPDVALLWL